MGGVILVGRLVAHEPPVDHRLSVVLAVAAALFAGAQLVALARAGATDALTGVTASRVTSVAVFICLLLVSRPPVPARTLPAAVVVGFSDTAANLAYTLASARTLLSLAGALASLYPVLTVALAHLLLRERLRPTQWAGAALALTGVLLIVGA